MRTAEILVVHLVFMALTVLAYASVVEITTSSLPNGVVAEAYSETIYATGGCTPYRWSITSGSLPAGLSAKESSSTESYVISGTPTTGESSTFMVEVVGCRGHISTHSYTLTIQSNYRVTLNWNASTSSDIIGYNVYRGTVSGGPYTEIASHVTETTYTDTAVADNETYYYVTTAVNNQNQQSQYSDQVIVEIP
jgi:hypothetical protein